MRTKNMLSATEVTKCRELFDALDAFALKKLAEKSDLPKQMTQNEAGALKSKVRQLWLKDHTIIDQFLEKNLAITADDKEIIVGWKKNLIDDFCLMKVYPEYVVFYSTETKQKYGAKVLFDLKLMSFPVPAFLATSLLFYKGIILWDGLAAVRSISVGKTMAKGFFEECEKDRKAGKIITSFCEDNKNSELICI